MHTIPVKGWSGDYTRSCTVHDNVDGECAHSVFPTHLIRQRVDASSERNICIQPLIPSWLRGGRHDTELLPREDQQKYVVGSRFGAAKHEGTNNIFLLIFSRYSELVGNVGSNFGRYGGSAITVHKLGAAGGWFSKSLLVGSWCNA